jgi:hypothetical protein
MMRAESFLAGAAIAGEVAAVEAEGIRSEMFADAAARRVFEAAQKCSAEGRAFDEATAGDVLADIVEGREPSLVAVEMMESYTSAAQLPAYAYEVREAWARRRKATAHAAIAEALRDGKPEVIPYYEKQLVEVEAEEIGDGGRLELVGNTELVARNTPIPPPLVDGLVNQGELVLVVAPAKTGKSWYALQLARAIASGGQFLGRTTAKGPVVFINTEIPSVYWESRCRALENAMGKAGDIQLFHACTRGMKLTVDNIVPMLRRAIVAKGLKQVAAIFIDPFYTLASGVDENDSGAVATIMLGLQRLAEELGAAVVVVHHCGKGDAVGKSVLDMARGSSAFVGSVDSFIGLAKLADGRVLFRGLRRNGGDPLPRYLRFEYPLWVDAGEVEDEFPAPKPEGDRKRTVGDIMEAFAFDGESLTGADIQARTKIPKTSLYRLLKEAVDGGHLLRDGDRYRPIEGNGVEDF